MSLPKEPRQLMINIMYLVLTALLALNVSAEILKAFTEANVALETNNLQMDQRRTTSFSMFRKKVEDNKGMGRDYLRTAENVSEYVTEKYNRLESIKQEFITYTGGYVSIKDPETGEEKITNQLRYADNKDKPTRYFVKGYVPSHSESSEPMDARGPIVRSIIDSSRLYILSNCPDDNVREEIESLLPIDVIVSDEEEISTLYNEWSREQFYQIPSIAAISIISRYQNQLRTAESIFIEKLSNMVTEDIVHLELDAALIPNGTKFFPGDKLVLESFLTASSSQSRPQITFNGVQRQTNEMGRAIYEEQLSSLGKKTISVKVKSKDTAGRWKTYDKSFTYEVVAPPDHMAIASADATKVLYIGVDNPITAGISGIPDSEVNVSLSQGDLSPKSLGQYNARVHTPGITELRVSGPKADGSGSYSENVKFRVERIPNPTAIVGADPDNNRGGNIRAAVFRAQEGIKAQLDNFLFNVDFEVVEYEVVYVKHREGVMTPFMNKGGRFSAMMKKYQSEISKDDKIFFDNIKAKGPDGKIRDLGSIAYNIR